MTGRSDLVHGVLMPLDIWQQ